MNKLILLGVLLIQSNIVQSKGYDDVSCLAYTIYHEARGESKKGKLAVANVIYNRIKNKKVFRRHNSICGVVNFRKHFVSYRPTQKQRNSKLFKSIFLLSKSLTKKIKAGTLVDVTNGSLYFASNGYIHKGTTKTTKIGGHQFFK